MIWVLSYIGANFALIIVVVLAVLALAAVAWFAKNWKVALAAVAVLVAGLAYQQVDKTAYQRRVAEEAAQQVELLQGRLDAIAKANEAYAKRAENDAAAMDALREQASQTPANDAACLPEDSAKRVGDIK